MKTISMQPENARAMERAGGQAVSLHERYTQANVGRLCRLGYHPSGERIRQYPGNILVFGNGDVEDRRAHAETDRRGGCDDQPLGTHG
jgi:tRNA-dihydrouridine synthase